MRTIVYIRHFKKQYAMREIAASWRRLCCCSKAEVAHSNSLGVALKAVHTLPRLRLGHTEHSRKRDSLKNISNLGGALTMNLSKADLRSLSVTDSAHLIRIGRSSHSRLLKRDSVQPTLDVVQRHNSTGRGLPASSKSTSGPPKTKRIKEKLDLVPHRTISVIIEAQIWQKRAYYSGNNAMIQCNKHY
jgi:hypothetical protein